MNNDKVFTQFVHDVISFLRANKSYYAIGHLCGVRPEVIKKFEDDPVHGSAESLAKLLDYFVDNYDTIWKVIADDAIDKKRGL